MKIISHRINDKTIAEIQAENVIIASAEDGTDLLGDVYYQGFDRLILHKHTITESFFDLKNKMAGEILQKFSNYRVKLAIVGNFDEHNSKSVQDFIRESNTIGHVNFVISVLEALEKLKK